METKGNLRKQNTEHRSRGRTPQWIGRWCLWTGLGVVSVQAGAQPYYISEMNGSDISGTGTQANPWQSFFYVQPLLSAGEANTTFYFERGGTYEGNLTVSNPLSSNLTFAAYGSGALPVFHGDRAITGWTQAFTVDAPDRWVVSNYFFTPKYIFDDGVLMTRARYPDAGWLRTGPNTTLTSIDDATLTGTGLWDDATAVVRTANWQYDMLPVNAHIPGSLTFSSNLGFLVEAVSHYYDWGYYLRDNLLACNVESEWYYDGANTALYFDGLGTGAPSNVSGAIWPQGISVDGVDGITVQDIAFERYTNSDIYFENATNVLVQRCDFTESEGGIGNGGNNTGHVYELSDFHDIYNMAIVSDASASSKILNNTFLDIGLIPGLGSGQYGVFGGYGAHRGIVVTGDGTEVADNRFENIGYTAIDAQGVGGHVHRNYIKSSLKILNDGGGIAFDDCSGLVVEDNIVEGITANFPANSISTSFSYYAFQDISFGIYFGDDNIVNTTVQDNTVSGCGAGVHVDHTHASTGNKVVHNTLFNNGAQLSIGDASAYRNCGGCNPWQASYGDTYEGNICYSLGPDQRCMQQSNRWADSWEGSEPIVDFGTFKDNYYFNPFSQVPVYINKRYDYRDRDVARTLEQWQAMDEDLNSHVSPLHGEEPNDFTPGAQEYTTNATFAGPDDWQGRTWQGTSEASCTINIGSGELSLNGCDWGENLDLGSLFPFDDQTDEGVYVMEFDARADAPGILEACGYRPIGGFDAIPTGAFVRVGSEMRHYKVFLDLRSVCGPCTTDYILPLFRDAEVEAGLTSNTYHIDNVSLRKADPNPLGYLPTTDHLLFTYNPLGDDIQTHTLPTGCWSDVYGNIYSGSLTIANEFESVVLFKLNTSYTIDQATYTLAQDEVWQQDRNVRGSVVVPSGKTLTVDGATIGFADSRQGTQVITNIVVEEGGTLTVINGGLLTSVPDANNSCEPGMWDGVKNLGNGTSVGAGVVELTSGGGITNAYVAILAADAADPLDPTQAIAGFGGQIELDGAVLENNWTDVFTRRNSGPAEHTYYNSSFRTTRTLHGQFPRPNLHIFAGETPKLTISGCTFENSDPTATDPANDLGRGIGAHLTSLDVVPGPNPAHRTRFTSQFLAVQHLSLNGAQQLLIDNADFENCFRANHIIGTDGVVITYNIYTVRDEEENYATYLHGGSMAHFKGNVYAGLGSSQPKVGSLFESLGIENQTFYNNRFDGFTGFGPTGYSAGTIIQGNNDGPLQSDGFHFRCNDYSNYVQNDYDLALTGPNVTVGNEQGLGSTASDADDPAGNTFNPGCTGGTSEQHIYVEEPNIQQFTYGHHDQSQSTAQVVPVCASPAIDQANWYSEAFGLYFDKTTACPPGAFGDGDPEDLWDEAVQAETEFASLKEVYGDWTDGGNTTGLVSFINDLSHSSYQVRNEMMLVAPSVSSEAWKNAFIRQVPLNPWHMAQALIANSPLQPEILTMMETYGFDGVYQQLVKNAQNGGTSMLSIMEAEMAHWYGKQAQATAAYTTLAMRSHSTTKLDSAVQLHTEHPLRTSARSLYALHLAASKMQLARDVVDEGLQDPELADYFTVQDMHLTLLEDEQDIQDLDANGIIALEGIVAQRGSGAAAAKAWLLMLGYNVKDEIILPKPVRAAPQTNDARLAIAPWSIAAYPNPANGPVFFVVCLPEGTEKALVRIIDPTGRLITDRAVPSGTNAIVEYDAQRQAAGVYVAALYADGIEVGHGAFTVVH